MLENEPRRCQVVLVVEDDPAIAEMYSFSLQRAGYQVLVAGNSTAALALAAEVGPDLVLMDIGLPGASGLDALQELRNSPATRSLPVVMLTNYGDPAFVRQSQDLGALDYLIKSHTSPALLADRVRGWCDQLTGGAV